MNTLLVLSAGIGSRYGGLKQIDPMGPTGEVVLDYSVYDAIRAGFKKVIFLIRKDIEKDFKALLEPHFKGRVEIEYAYQELEDLPNGIKVPTGRSKPWGTTHAVWACRDIISEPFGVINADDFYGRRSFHLLAESLRRMENKKDEYSLIGFILKNTLSKYGGVSRGICRMDNQENLSQVAETHKIRKENGKILCSEEGTSLNGEEVVSMNMWGFTPDFFAYAENYLVDFLGKLDVPEKDECYIPDVVDWLIRTNQALTKVISSDESWFGVTYPEDKPVVEQGIRKLIERGVYPSSLWVY